MKRLENFWFVVHGLIIGIAAWQAPQHMTGLTRYESLSPFYMTSTLVRGESEVGLCSDFVATQYSRR